MGERGMVRELAERGERTWVWSFALEVVRVGGMGAPRGRFLGFSRSSFSLSREEISSLKLLAGGIGKRVRGLPVTFLRSLGRGTGA